MPSTTAVAEMRPASSPSFAAATLRAVIFMADGFARWTMAASARARTRRALSSLDDYALKDIGLSRGQVDGFEHDARYTPRTTRH